MECFRSSVLNRSLLVVTLLLNDDDDISETNMSCNIDNSVDVLRPSKACCLQKLGQYVIKITFPRYR